MDIVSLVSLLVAAAALTGLGLSLVAANKRQKSFEELVARESSARQESLSLASQLTAAQTKINETSRELSQAREAHIASQTEAKNLYSQLESEKKLLAEAKDQLKTVFESSAATALKNNSEQFIALANQILVKHTDAAKGDLKQKELAIDAMVKPLKESIDKYQVHLRELEASRQKAYATVETGLKQMAETGRLLSTETRALKDALKKPHVRGRWGEVQLKNCVELAGMSEYADVTFQDSQETEESRVIPDMTVRMPGGRVVIVDSKAPLDAFIASLEATTDEARGIETARHGRQVKDHVKKLSLKAYQDHVAGSADFTVMFLPNESFLYAALESEPDLMEFALDKKILIATPPTFVGLLKVIRYGWREERMAQNAAKISEVGEELHKRLVDFVDAFEKIGYHLNKACEEFDSGRTRLSSRVIVQARKLETLGLKVRKELPEDLGNDQLSLDAPVADVLPFNASEVK